MSISEKAKAFDPKRKARKAIDDAIKVLTQFRKRFPFHTNPSKIDELKPEDVYSPRVSKDYFFYWLEYNLKPLGKMAVGSTIAHRHARQHLDDFKELLHSVVDQNLSLAEKVDLNWWKIKGIGGERIVAKKIISVYHDDVLPIFKTSHLKHFHDALVGRGTLPRNFERLSLGEKYQTLMEGLLKEKNRNDIVAHWDGPYFVKFLYDAYPTKGEKIEQPPVSLDAVRVHGLNDFPRSEQEVLFLFSKLHSELGYPTVVKIQIEFPDIQALDERGDTIRIELEYRASHFEDHKHPPEKCEVVICWENDMGEAWPEHWPEIISLREYLAES